MSAFNDYRKDEIIDYVRLIVKEEFEKGKQPHEIIEEIMKVFTLAINNAVYDLFMEKT